ncbi:DUF5810 domain-containing protein [Halorubrum luteum]
MGYACPVCGVPQRDGEHLAHHLAFTAMIHGDDHEAWLDEHVADWADRGPDGLADRVVDHAREAEYHEVFEDTVDRGRPDVDVGGHAGHGRHDHADHGRAGGASPAVDTSGGTDPETAAVIEEARELTRELYDESEGAETSADDAAGAATDDDPRS